MKGNVCEGNLDSNGTERIFNQTVHVSSLLILFQVSFVSIVRTDAGKVSFVSIVRTDAGTPGRRNMVSRAVTIRKMKPGGKTAFKMSVLLAANTVNK
jgi:hypothetical protein